MIYIHLHYFHLALILLFLHVLEKSRFHLGEKGKGRNGTEEGVEETLYVERGGRVLRLTR